MRTRKEALSQPRLLALVLFCQPQSIPRGIARSSGWPRSLVHLYSQRGAGRAGVFPDWGTFLAELLASYHRLAQESLLSAWILEGKFLLDIPERTWLHIVRHFSVFSL